MNEEYSLETLIRAYDRQKDILASGASDVLSEERELLISIRRGIGGRTALPPEQVDSILESENSVEERVAQLTR